MRSRREETGRRKDEGGFSIIEVLVSLAILGMALVIVARIITGDVRATHHARMTTAATFLARTRISMMEQSLQQYGFAELDGKDNGSFAEESFPSFRWYTNVERIELPADSAQKVQQAASSQTLSNNPMEMLSGFMGGFMSTLMDPIRLGLQESVRKMTVRVKWDEAGKPEQSLEVVAFFTDPSRLESAVTLTAGGGTGGPAGSGSGTGTPGSPKPVPSSGALGSGTKK